MLLKNLLSTIPKEYENLEIKGVTCDSRKVEDGFCFVCIDGTALDGHKFAKKAEEAGASVIIGTKPTGCKNEIILEDTRKVYAIMSANFFDNPAKKLKLIGVTGTNGKTSVTYMIKSILEKQGFKTGVIGTIQNLVADEVVETNNTTPDPYELNRLFAYMHEKGCEYAIMEVSSHALDQDRVYGFEFDVAAFTNLTQDHLDYHVTMENYLLAKKKLFSMCKTAVINIDDKYAEELMSGLDCEILTYSVKNNNSTYSANGIQMHPDGIEYELVGYNTINHVKVKTGGKFTVYNSLCAAVCSVALGFNTSNIVSALAENTGIKGRAEVVPTGKDFTIIIDYAHTPDGLQNILSTFKELKKNRLICLFGCGGDRDKTKRPLMGAIAARLADFVVVTSDNPRTEEPMSIIEDILKGINDYKTPYKVIENRADAINYVVKNAQKDDIIILAGKGHETYQILNTGKIHLDEREIILEALK